MLKKLVITGAMGAIMLSSAAGIFAWGGNHTYTSHSYNTSNKTITVTKATVDNHADISNMVFTFSNTGLNFTGSNGGTTQADTTTGKTEDGSTTGNVTGGTAMGGASSAVTTGNAGAESVVSNVVNTTTISL